MEGLISKVFPASAVEGCVRLPVSHGEGYYLLGVSVSSSCQKGSEKRGYV